MDNQQTDDGFFVIARVHRDDLSEAGFDASQVDDATMRRLADKLGDAYVGDAFWFAISIIAEDLAIPATKDQTKDTKQK